MLPKRYRQTGVGKFIGNSLYFHKLYLAEVLLVFPQFVDFFTKIGDQYQYNIVKLNFSTNAVTLLQSPVFDEVDEPWIETAYLFRDACFFTEAKQLFYSEDNPPVYHHKWLFVKDDYQGFDVQKSKERSRAWYFLPWIDKSKIGYKKDWSAVLCKLSNMSNL